MFPLFSPIVEKIDVVRKGDVRRAKLYYLRELSGKKARIADRDRGDEADQYEFIEEISKEEVKQTENSEETQSQPAEQEKPAEEAQPAEELKAEEAQPKEESKAEDNPKAEDNSDESK